MARPAKPIDWNIVNKLGRIFCTAEEIAEVLGIHCDTLEIRCKKEHGITISKYLEERRNGGKVSLRHSQFQKAEAGNVTMLIWLGKQYLGQTDKMTTEGNLTLRNVHDALAKIIDEQNVFSP